MAKQIMPQKLIVTSTFSGIVVIWIGNEQITCLAEEMLVINEQRELWGILGRWETGQHSQIKENTKEV